MLGIVHFHYGMKGTLPIYFRISELGLQSSYKIAHEGVFSI
jgi:hypothetical protein